MRYMLYRMFADGTVAPFVRCETKARARSTAQHARMTAGQVNWGVAWGFPESAVTPLFPRA